MAERNLNWVSVPIPEECKSICVFMDGELFDEFVNVGLVPLHDERKMPKYGEPGYEMPVFIGYVPGEDPQDPKGPDILDRLRAARRIGDAQYIRSGNDCAPDPSQGPDSDQK